MTVINGLSVCVFFSEDVLQEKGRLKKDVVWTAIKVHFILKGIQNCQIRTPLETIEIYCLTRPMGGGSGDCRLRWRRFFFRCYLFAPPPVTSDTFGCHHSIVVLFNVFQCLDYFVVVVDLFIFYQTRNKYKSYN